MVKRTQPKRQDHYLGTSALLMISYPLPFLSTVTVDDPTSAAFPLRRARPSVRSLPIFRHCQRHSVSNTHKHTQLTLSADISAPSVPHTHTDSTDFSVHPFLSLFQSLADRLRDQRHSRPTLTHNQRAKTKNSIYLTASQTVHRVLVTQDSPHPITEETQEKRSTSLPLRQCKGYSQPR